MRKVNAEVEDEQGLPPWINEDMLKLYTDVYGLDRKDAINRINEQMKSVLSSGGASKLKLPVPRR